MKAKEGLHIDFIIYVKKDCISVYLCMHSPAIETMSSRVKLTMFTGM